MILDHIDPSVCDQVRSKLVFTQAVAPWGIGLVTEVRGGTDTTSRQSVTGHRAETGPLPC